MSDKKPVISGKDWISYSVFNLRCNAPVPFNIHIGEFVGATIGIRFCGGIYRVDFKLFLQSL
jgi:hypothetical protein